MALVRCSCGYETTIRYDSIGKGSSACYRCANISHGDSHTRFYSIWKNMIHRCHNPKSDNYLRYGALGIKVCSDWQDYNKFKIDMYESYCEHVEIFGVDNTSIDRRNNSLGYVKSNCRWATNHTQRCNRGN